MKDQIKIFERKVDLDSRIYKLLKNYSERGDNRIWREWSRILVLAKDSGVDYPKNNISFLEFDKEAFIRTDDQKPRQSIKLGRAIRQILLGIRPELDLDSQVGDFGNFIQFLQGGLSDTNDLELVSGPQIAQYYKKENTADVSGSEIYKSCMVGKPSSTFDIYTKNPNRVSMIVRLAKGKVQARALVWKLTDPSDCIYLDRIYSVINSDRELSQFLIFLEEKFPEKKILFRNQSDLDTTNFRVELDNFLFTKYPYLDSFGYLFVEYEKYNPVKNIITRVKDFFGNKKLQTSWAGKIVRAINRGFLTINRNYRAENDYLLFELRNHSTGISSPLNCATIDYENNIYKVSIDVEEAVELFNSGENFTVSELISICHLVFNSSRYRVDQKKEIIMKVLDKLIVEKKDIEVPEFLVDFVTDEYLLNLIKKYKKVIYFRFYRNISRKFSDPEFLKKFLDLFPEGFDKNLFFYLDVNTGYNLDRKHLRLVGGYTPLRSEKVWNYLDMRFLFEERNANKKELYVQLFFDYLLKNYAKYLLRYYLKRKDSKKMKLILDKTENPDNLHSLLYWVSDEFSDKKLFLELYETIIEKIVKFEDPIATIDILDILLRFPVYDKTSPRQLFDDLYEKGLDPKILNDYIRKKRLDKDEGFKFYPEVVTTGNRILKFRNYFQK